MSGDRSVVDDSSALRCLISHHLISAVGHQESTVQVDIDDRVPIVQCKVAKICGWHIVTGIVEKNVQASIVAANLIKQRIDRRFIGHIA